MSESIGLKEIEIFRFLEGDQTATIKEHFSKIDGEKGEVLFQKGDLVPGLYVVLRGSFEVILQGSDLPIARIWRGSSVGEMTLIGEDSKSGPERATATVRCGEEGASYIFCSREDLNEIFARDHIFSKALFRGIARLVSQRLRITNDKITAQLEHGHKKIQDFLREIEVFSKLNQTKNSLDEAGFNIVSHLNEVSTDLDKIIEAIDKEELKEGLKKVQTMIDQVLFQDSQNFDRICQMLDQLSQYFENLKSVVRGGSTTRIKGDTSLFQ